jgi:putative phosphotransacetylase
VPARQKKEKEMNADHESVITSVLSLINGKGGRECAFSDGIPVGVSNRHIHLSRADLETLFGVGYELTAQKKLGQPGQFAAKETVCIAGRKGAFPSVRVLGPVRKESQVEISRSDAFALGVNPPVRISGDLVRAADICVIGPEGMLVLKGKTILAKRHVHMLPEEAQRFGVCDGQLVSLEVGNDKKCIFHNVAVRVAVESGLEFHIDTDEANGADVGNGMVARLI